MTLILERPETPGITNDTLQVCILGADPAMMELLQGTVGQFGMGSMSTSDPRRALDELGGTCRVVFCDVDIPGMDGLRFLKEALKRDPGTFVVLMADRDSIESANYAVRQGAYDYLSKPIDHTRVPRQNSIRP